MQRHPVPVPGQRHVSGMPVHVLRRQHVRPVHRHALRLVDRRRIAVVYVRVVAQVEGRDRALPPLTVPPLARLAGAGDAIELHRQPLAAGLHRQHRPQRAVLHRNAALAAGPGAKRPLVAEEHESVPGRHRPLAPLGLHHLVRTEFAPARSLSRASWFNAVTSARV